MTHLHITSWVLGLILFIIAIMLLNQGKQKPAKITHMILRLDYLFILLSGGHLLGLYFSANMGQTGEVIAKALVGIWVIAAMEMILAKKRKNKPVKGAWIQFVIALVLTLTLGFVRLQMGVSL